MTSLNILLLVQKIPANMVNISINYRGKVFLRDALMKSSCAGRGVIRKGKTYGLDSQQRLSQVLPLLFEMVF